MATVVERVGVLEVKVQHIDEKIDVLKGDVKEMHDCLDRTRDLLDGKLDGMLQEYRDNRDKFYEHADKLHKEQSAQHQELAGKVEAVEKSKDKMMLYGAIGAAFLAGLGWSGNLSFPVILKFFGL